MQIKRTRRGYTHSWFPRGFTLIEMLVVVLIIGILGAIALPQYQRAVLKSRFAALMPIAKSMADSNEAYFLEHGEYAEDAQDLPVQGRNNYPDGTELEFGTTTSHAYVLATRDNDFPNNYIVYQKHSENYPGEIHCEANANDTKAQEVCKSFGPTQELGETLTSGYLTYVLFGTGNGVAPTGDNGGNDEPSCEGVSCDEQGNITECASGQTLNNGSCEECATAFPGAAACSTTAYKPTACSEGYTLNSVGNSCVEIPTVTCGGVAKPVAQTESCGNGYVSGNKIQEAECVGDTWRFFNVWDWSSCQADPNSIQTVLNSSTCTGDYAGYCHDNGDGTISRCTPERSIYDAQAHQCIPSAKPNYYFPYEEKYNADGKRILLKQCSATSTSGNECYAIQEYIVDPITERNVSTKHRICQTNVALDQNLECTNGGLVYGEDSRISPSTGKVIASYICNSNCSTYSSMTEWNDMQTQARTCKKLSTTTQSCDEWNAWTNN